MANVYVAQCLVTYLFVNLSSDKCDETLVSTFLSFQSRLDELMDCIFFAEMVLRLIKTRDPLLCKVGMITPHTFELTEEERA